MRVRFVTCRQFLRFRTLRLHHPLWLRGSRCSRPLRRPWHRQRKDRDSSGGCSAEDPRINHNFPALPTTPMLHISIHPLPRRITGRPTSIPSIRKRARRPLQADPTTSHPRSSQLYHRAPILHTRSRSRRLPRWRRSIRRSSGDGRSRCRRTRSPRSCPWTSSRLPPSQRFSPRNRVRASVVYARL